ncbi:MAG: ABC transporter ATP-binding protein [Pseudomonadota bacterium]|nr:ABC transporter ATP-binding protein [Pseudomonadota bacterium]
MVDIALELSRVYKKFSRGEMYDSLRDLVPALVRMGFSKHSQNHLEKREFWAIDNVDFQVNKGEAFGIIGDNGAGKSTILKLLSRIIQPTSGQISVYGKLSALIEVGAGFHPDLTGRENIYLYGAILGMKREEIRSKFDEIVEFSELSDFIDTPVKRYSSGMYARLGFAVAAHVDPEILVVDEALSVGDFLFQKKCLEKMGSIRRKGATVIFVSHNLKAVSELCDRTLLLDKGKVVTIGPTGEVFNTYMDRALAKSKITSGKAASLLNVTIRSEQGKCVQFNSGQKAWVDIEVIAHEECKSLGLAIEFKDEYYYTVFLTSARRLGKDAFALGAGDLFRCTVELDLHLAKGIFHLGVTLYRYDIMAPCDETFPAATVFIEPDRDVLGSVNLYPQIVCYESIGSRGCIQANEVERPDGHRKL